MASFRAVTGVLGSLMDHFERHLNGDLGDGAATPKAKILGTQDLRTEPTGNEMGLYPHRISLDAFGLNRYLQPTRPNEHLPARAAGEPEPTPGGWNSSSNAETTLAPGECTRSAGPWTWTSPTWAVLTLAGGSATACR